MSYNSICNSCNHRKICNKKELMQNAETEVNLFKSKIKIEKNKIIFDNEPLNYSKYSDYLQKNYGIKLTVDCEDHEQDLHVTPIRR